MQYRTLGKTELKVSNVSLGTMTFGRQNSEPESHEQLDYAFSRGVNFIDTAELYAVPSGPEFAGETEKIIGNWLKTKSRDDVMIASKVAGRSNMDFLRESHSETRLNKEQITAALEGSLKRLDTDYIDVLPFVLTFSPIERRLPQKLPMPPPLDASHTFSFQSSTIPERLSFASFRKQEIGRPRFVPPLLRTGVAGINHNLLI
ncbi:aldo/keto reductase [Emcibacteraceae bacterium]|nr:aldo/keto reductase [Emcibacteraceae bacterium]